MEWGTLRRGVRIELPTCTTTLIRNRYPSPRNAYIGYHEHDNSLLRVRAVDADGIKVETLFWVKLKNEWCLQNEIGEAINMNEHPECVKPAE